MPRRRVALAVSVLGVLGAVVLGQALRFEREPSAPPAPENEVAQADAPETGGAPDAGTVGMGDAALASASPASPVDAAGQTGMAQRLPKDPLDGQKRPPCYPRWGEVQLNGGCWFSNVGMKPPCGPREYEWEGRCYLPVWAADRPPTSDQPGAP